MNVLITGGRSTIVKCLAERFYKEGESTILVEIVNSLKHTKEKYKGAAFKCYQIEDNKEKLEWVFKVNQFDIVIYVEDQWEKAEEKRFNRLMQYIELAHQYGVGQLIFVPMVHKELNSSYAVFRKKLLEGRFMGELSLTTLDASYIYGPNLKEEELEKEVVAYIKAALNGQNKSLKQQNYYYIGDVIDAVYKLASQKHVGVFELGKDTIQGWQPKYSLEVGLEKTVAWYVKNKDFWEIDKLAEKQAFLKRLKFLLPYGENTIIFLITFFIAYQTRDNTVRYNVFPIDLNLIYIFLISMVHGMGQGIIAILLACFSYVYVYLCVSPELAGIIYNQTHIIQLLVYVLVGVLTAYVVDNKHRQIENLKADLKMANEKQNFVEEVCQQVADVKEELQEQILNTENSLGKIYELSRELNSLLLEDVYYGAIHTLEKLLKTQSISIYKCNHTKTFLRLMTHSKNLLSEAAASLRIDDYEAIRNLIATKEIFINYKLDEKLPMLMAPIVYREEVIAVVFVDGVPFENLTLYYENFFRVAIGLIQNAIAQALAYEEAIKHKKYIGDSGVVQIAYFNEIIKNKQRAKVQFNIPYTILQVEVGVHLSRAHEIRQCIRETDYIGSNEMDEIYIMLSNSDMTSSQLIVERLNKKGIEAVICKGVSA
ncbi:DUF4118 domain-containing protein [Cellulosilyticum ruminicola]|uniref:DUF4118 domain-containing protein n=1 Tax=Cellulosilyticum ruminicola TaxID=425254 RepID=UPI0006D1B339|nr:DUF4118 domain-containing protein [Cellulosilyticum ruminicola]